MIQLRDARQNELPSLSALCLRSKAVWGYDDAFMIACRAELTLVPDELKSTQVQVAERDTILAGLTQVKVTETDADLLKLFVEPALLRSGVGSALFEWATARAKSLGAVRMVIEADPVPRLFTNAWAPVMRVSLPPNPSRDGCCRVCCWNWTNQHRSGRVSS